MKRLGEDHWTRRARKRQEARDAAARRLVRQAKANGWYEGVLVALNHSVRNEDGIRLSLDLKAHPNPYDDAHHDEKD